MTLRITRTWISLTVWGICVGTNFRELAIRTEGYGACYALPSFREVWRED
jgi:hypothetical protein